MALINHRTRQINFKIVYYGPGLGGKTTNLVLLHDRLPPGRRGRLISIATDHERTLFFDFLPVDIGEVSGFTTRFHLYTVPGQVYYRLSRRAVLQGVDGLAFVADSHPAREQANLESLADLEEHLAAQGLTPEQALRIPRVVQYNKRDLFGALAIERMRAALNPLGAPEFEAVATQGRGVTETLKAACKAVLARLVGAPAAAASGVEELAGDGVDGATAVDAPRAAADLDAGARPDSAAAAGACGLAPTPPSGL